MFLAHYHFDGDPAHLEAAYLRFLESLPSEAIALQIGLKSASGFDVWDTCPDRATFERFSTGDAFLGALQGAGLPLPTVSPVGTATAAFARGARLC